MWKPATHFLPDQDERAALEQYGILRVPLDTPYKSEPVNVYIVLGDPIVLIDGGLRYQDNLDKIVDALHAVGHKLEDVGQIWLTHTHIDHFGLAHDIATRANATIHAWSGAVDRLQQYYTHWPNDREAFAQLVANAGAPPHVLQDIRNAPNQSHLYASPIHIHQPMHCQENYTLAGRFPATLLHTPGHSPWCTSFWLPQAQLLFSGDALLKRVRFTVLLYPEEQCSQLPQGYIAYPNTLQTLLQLPIARNLPGHGASFCDTQAFIERTLRQQRNRQQQIAAWLDDGPRQAYDIAIQLFGDTITHMFLLLVMSEIIAHLEWLIHEGQAHSFEQQQQRWYQKTTTPL